METASAHTVWDGVEMNKSNVLFNLFWTENYMSCWESGT